MLRDLTGNEIEAYGRDGAVHLPPFEAIEGKPPGGDLFPRVWPR